MRSKDVVFGPGKNLYSTKGLYFYMNRHQQHTSVALKMEYPFVEEILIKLGYEI